MRRTNLFITVIAFVLFIAYSTLVNNKIASQREEIKDLKSQVREYKFNQHVDSLISSNKEAFEKKLDSSYNKTFK